MAQTTKSTTNLGVQDFFSTTLSSGCTAADTTIYLTTLPTASEGYLLLDAGTAGTQELIFYNAKGANYVTVPTTGDRGIGGTTAAAHSSGAAVKQTINADYFNSLKSGDANTGMQTYFDNATFDFVESGCVWSGDSYGASLAASMTSGVLWINGKRLTVAAVTARAFTANLDTYIDFSESPTVPGTAIPTYTTAANNAASPALSANYIRVGIIQAGATITAATKVNQGQEDRVFPIASSTPYAVTDSLGNLICPRDPLRKLLGMRTIISSLSITNTSPTLLTGLSVPVIVPTGRKIKVSLVCPKVAPGTSYTDITLYVYEGATLNALTTQKTANVQNVSGSGSAMTSQHVEVIYTPTTASIFLTAATSKATNGSTEVTASATAPVYIKVELV